MKIRLVRPTEQLKEQAINFRQEFFDNRPLAKLAQAVKVADASN